MATIGAITRAVGRSGLRRPTRSRGSGAPGSTPRRADTYAKASHKSCIQSPGRKPVRRVGATVSVCTWCDRRRQLPFCQRLALRMPSLSTAFPTYSGDNPTPWQATGSHGLANRAMPDGRPVNSAYGRVAEMLKFDQRRARHRVAVGTRQLGITFKPRLRIIEAFERGAMGRTVVWSPPRKPARLSRYT